MPRHTSSHFIFVMRFSTGRERRLLEGFFRHVRRERLPQVSACMTSCRVPQSSHSGLNDPRFLNENFLQKYYPMMFSFWTDFGIRSRHFDSHLQSQLTALVWCFEILLHLWNIFVSLLRDYFYPVCKETKAGFPGQCIKRYRWQMPLPFKIFKAHTSTVSTFNYTFTVSM